MKDKLSAIIQGKVLQHLLFWALSYYVLYRLFAYNKEANLTDLLYTLLFHFSLFVAVYINLVLLIPNFLKPQRYVLYLVFFLLTLFLGTNLNIWTFEYFSDFLFPGYYFISYFEFNEIAQFVSIYLVVTTLLKLSKGWFYLIEQRKKINQLEKEKLDAELSALKAQIDPHYLFNTLNNLYALALEEDKKTPEIILKLSQSMRYMLYECRDQYVPLKKELNYIQTYLELQQLRSDHHAQINFKVEGAIEEQQIAPLLFIPFIENGFKHGIKAEQEAPYINILFKLEEKQLIFTVENGKGEKDDSLIEDGGIGLNNTKRRLQLLYPNQHSLQIIDGINHFLVELKIDLP